MEKLFWRFSFSELWRMSDCYFRLYRCVWKSTKNKLLIELAVWEESEKARVVCVWNFSIPSTLCKARVVLVASTDRGWWEERGGGSSTGRWRGVGVALTSSVTWHQASRSQCLTGAGCQPRARGLVNPSQLTNSQLLKWSGAKYNS